MEHIFAAQTHQVEPYLYIGKVAKITGASSKAIRHYESLGLLPIPQRWGNYRIYSERDVFLIHMIKHAQSCGFNLCELRELVAEKISKNRFPLQLANTLFDSKRAAIQAEINALQNLEQRLATIKMDMNRIFS